MTTIIPNSDDEYDDNGNIIVDMNITPLRLASKSKKYIKEVLKRGYDINQLDPNDVMPNSLICFLRFIDDIRLVLKYGADPNIIDREGFTPFHIILFSKNLNNIRCLLNESSIVVDLRIPIPEDGSAFDYNQKYLNIWLRRMCHCNESRSLCFRCKGVQLYSDIADMLYSHKNKTFSLFEMMIEKIDQFQ